MGRIYTEIDFDITPDRLSRQESLFHVANGYIGVRGTLEEGVPESFDTMRGIYLNGVYDTIAMKQAENLCNLVNSKDAMFNAADAQSVSICIGGERFSLFEGTVRHIERTLDMDAGVALRKVDWISPSGHEVIISFRRMASFDIRSLFTIDIGISSPSFSGTVEFISESRGCVPGYSSHLDPRLPAEGEVHTVPLGCTLSENGGVLLSRAKGSGIEVAAAVSASCSSAFDSEISYDERLHGLRHIIRGRLEPGGCIRFVQHAILLDSRRSDHPVDDSLSLMRGCEGRIDELYARQRSFLESFWERAAMHIEGDDALDTAINFCIYQLLQAAGHDGLCSIAAKGLSGEGYEGHYFWDAEMYMLPFFILTDPESARDILSFRYRTLDAARRNARLLGHRSGALYPWRTISGAECSGYFPSGSAQYHINGAVAYAIAGYHAATGDDDYLCREGAEILVEAARLWMSVGNWHDGRFMINGVTGPDEYTCIVNNNYYTNAVARFNLMYAGSVISRFAVSHPEVLERLGIGSEEAGEFRRAAECMLMPYDEGLGINAQDDSFLQKPVWDISSTPKEDLPLLLHYHPLFLYRWQVCKQADTVMAYVLFPDIEKPDVMLRSFRYYERITTHDSSLSACMFSIAAARLGLPAEASRYFGNSLLLDIENTHGNTKDGIHLANIGGAYLALTRGFAGLYLEEDGVRIRSPLLPHGWTGFRFRFSYRGSLAEFSIDSEAWSLSVIDGEGFPVITDSGTVIAGPDSPVKVMLWMQA